MDKITLNRKRAQALMNEMDPMGGEGRIRKTVQRYFLSGMDADRAEAEQALAQLPHERLRELAGANGLLS